MTREELDDQAVLEKKWLKQEAAKNTTKKDQTKPEIAPPKFCLNCRWITADWRCSRDKVQSLVTGSWLEIYCEEWRKPDGKCGPDAKLWEEKV